MHRLDNKAERKRCEAAGSEVCKSTVDGKPVGPDRVWPGGLAMSRTIGDYMVRPAAMLHTTCHISSLYIYMYIPSAMYVSLSTELWSA